MKLRIIVILFLLYLLAFISLNYSLNLLSPYYYIKDLIIYPVLASVNHQELNLSLEMQNNLLESKSKEIEELKKLLAMKNVLTEFNYLNATIIMRNREYWFNTITIDKGKKDGIKEDMAVIDNNGLLGRISMVNENTSTVKLITTNDVTSKISVLIGDNLYGITDGYDMDKHLLRVIAISEASDVLEKEVLTTGMGGVFPKGILIGKVKQKEKLNDYVTDLLYVELASYVEGGNYVSVLQRKESLDN